MQDVFDWSHTQDPIRISDGCRLRISTKRIEITPLVFKLVPTRLKINQRFRKFRIEKRVLFGNPRCLLRDMPIRHSTLHCVFNPKIERLFAID